MVAKRDAAAVAAFPRGRRAMRCLCRSAAVLLMIGALEAASTAFAATALDEVRSAFTVEGKPIPPEIFDDLGDGDLSDSNSILVTVDVRAATGSNRYADPITKYGRWVKQTKANDKTLNGYEETAYQFIGRTRNDLLVVVASYSGGGTGTFNTLHILDAALAPAFDENGKIYQRLNLTVLRSVALGDRWDGTVTITGNMVHVLTKATTGGSGGALNSIEARRP
jgi:hypothetical protein